MEFLKQTPRFLLFTGKGGVGKTTISCATAVYLADQGQRVLLVSTDPASNLDEVLGVPLGSQPTSIPSVPGLWALNLDPDQAAANYRERFIAPYRGVLPETALRGMEEQLSGSCTMEIAAFNEFAGLFGDAATQRDFDLLVFDTAPTGHTLRLLALPAAWNGFIEQNSTGTSCLGPLAGLRDQQDVYQRALTALRDANQTRLVLVVRPEAAALREAARTARELQALGIARQHLVVNALFRSADETDPVARAWQRRATEVLRDIPPELAALPRTEIPLSSHNILGVDGLRELFREQESRSVPPPETPVLLDATPPLGSEWTELIDRLAQRGRGVIMTLGKGGVGKSTLAAAIALRLAQQGHAVHLTTTDPAAHLTLTLGDADFPNLRVSCIDPREQVRAYSEQVLREAGADLDASARALLEEDLRSPCTEEIAVFRAFAAAVAEGTDRFVVLDTAPTGHTILLLDAALNYHREVQRLIQHIPDAVARLLPRLRDPDFSQLLIVTLPESTPVHEAACLQDDLQRAGIEPAGWVVNQALTPLPITDPLLARRKQAEQDRIAEVAVLSQQRFTVIPWQITPPVGIEALLRFPELGTPYPTKIPHHSHGHAMTE